MRRWNSAIATAAVVVSVGLGAFGQDDEMVSVHDGVYSEEQAERGEELFGEICLACHEPEQFLGPAYMEGWTNQPASDFLDVIRSTMPEDNPGSLKRSEYTAILTYIFKINGIPAGDADLESTSAALRQIRIEGPYAGTNENE